jgi:hypothetical protein
MRSESKLDSVSLGVTDLNETDLTCTNGGLIWFVAIAAVALLASCDSQTNVNTGSGTQVSVQCNDCSVSVQQCGDTTKVTVINK